MRVQNPWTSRPQIREWLFDVDLPLCYTCNMSNITIDAQTGCWLWGQKRKRSTNYGAVMIEGRYCRVHRVAWNLFNGPIRVRQEVMHTCDHPSCINPSHLRVGYHVDNMRDMHEKGRARNGAKWKTKCLNGHPFSEENTYWYPDGQRRSCRACMIIHAERYRKKFSKK